MVGIHAAPELVDLLVQLALNWCICWNRVDRCHRRTKWRVKQLELAKKRVDASKSPDERLAAESQLKNLLADFRQRELSEEGGNSKREDVLDRHPFPRLIKRLSRMTGLSSKNLQEAAIREFDGDETIVNALHGLESNCDWIGGFYRRFCKEYPEHAKKVGLNAATAGNSRALSAAPLGNLTVTDSKVSVEGHRAARSPGLEVSREKALTNRMPLDEANERARRFIKVRMKRCRVMPTVREIAANVGCATGQVGKLPAYRAAKEKYDQLQEGKRPKAISITKKVESGLGVDDEVLNCLTGRKRRSSDSDAELDHLIHEQSVDDEGSPLAETNLKRGYRARGGV